LLAAFVSVTDAVSAAVQIGRQVTGVQIGVHQGACVAANVAGRLEYAGQMVDLACGLARAGRPGEIVASLDVGRAAGVTGLLQAAGLRLDDALIPLPDVQEAVPVIRALPPDPASPQPALPTPSLAPASLMESPPLLGVTALRDWLARRHGPLRFDYRPDSYAGERIDAVVASYAAALDRILAFIGRGELEVIVRDEQDEDRPINVLSEGDYVGELSFLRGVPRTATLRARTPTELYVLRRLDVDQLLARLDLGLLAEHPELLGQLEATAQARLDETVAHLATLPA
jgi:hypothetical protein